jgi:hypothetical protein
MALLQIHGEEFASMIEVGEDCDPIVLDDSVDAFSEFLQVLLRSILPSLQTKSITRLSSLLILGSRLDPSNLVSRIVTLHPIFQRC